MAACWDECLHAGLEIELPVLGPDLVRMALAAGGPGPCEAQVTDEVARLAKAEDVASHRGAARRCQGLLDGDPEPLIEAVDDCPPARPSPDGRAGRGGRRDRARADRRRRRRAPLPRSGTRDVRGHGRRLQRNKGRSADARAGCPARCPGPPGTVRAPAGPASPRPSARGWIWSQSGCRTRRSRAACPCHAEDRPDPPRHVFGKLDITLERSRRRACPPRTRPPPLTRPLHVARLADVPAGGPSRLEAWRRACGAGGR